MIRSVHLQNLKCFDSLKIELAPLTVFSGFNSAGKSTTLQSLLLLSQTLKAHHGGSSLKLNGEFTSLGSPSDVLGNSGISAPLQLGFGTDDATDLLWSFRLSEDRRFLEPESLTISRDQSTELLPADQLEGLQPILDVTGIRKAVTKLRNIVYISAARLVEIDVFPIPEDTDLKAGNVGPLGEYASWWLHRHEDALVSRRRSCDMASDNLTLRNQLNDWASHLFVQAELNSIPIQKTNLMRLELKTGLTSDWSRPANNGYGVSYAFPVLTAGLISAPGQTIIIDSPEAHLHPRGQSRMGSFLAQMAADGVQLLVETHSDHLLNGVRLALRNGLISPDEVAIYFFTGQEEARVLRLSVSKDGDISNWPEGFFDQSEKDLATLAGWS
jgi:predicted ATPase